MTLRFFPFNSVNQDRIYTAEDFAAFVAGQISDGVVLGNVGGAAMKVNAGTGLSVDVSLGKAFIQGRFFEVFNSAQNVPIASNTSGMNRIDRIVIRLDFTTRVIGLVAKQGTTSPPALTRNASMWELSLAQVTVPHMAASILQSNILDERNDLFLCGTAYPASQVEGFQNIPASGWRRIAVTNGFQNPTEPTRYNQANAKFFIGTDEFGTSIQEQMVLEVSITNGVPTINMLSRTKSTGVFDGIRVVVDGTTKAAALEIELNTSAKVTFVIINDFADNGWFPRNWEAGDAVGLQVTELPITLTETMASVSNMAAVPFKVFQNGGIQTTQVANFLSQIIVGDNTQTTLIASDVVPPLNIAGDATKRSTFYLEQMPVARATQTVGQNFPDLTPTLVTFNVENFDTDGIIDLGSSTTNFTVQTDGYYQINATLTLSTSTAGTFRQVAILKNGTIVAQQRIHPPNSTAILSCHTIIDAVQGDVFTMQGLHNAGVTLTSIIVTNMPHMAIGLISGDLTLPT